MKKVFELLGSGSLTIWAITVFIVYYLTMAIWSEEAFSKFINALSHNWIARVLYILFVVNVSIRLLRFLSKTIKENKIKFLLRLPLAIGIILFLLSSFLSINLRQVRWLLVRQGQDIVIPWERGYFKIIEIEPAIKKSTIRIGQSTRVFDYEPFLLLQDPYGKIHRIGAFPVRKISKTYFHVLNFGLAPKVELYKDNKLLKKGYLALKVLPFGAVDRFKINGLAYEFFIHIVPNKIIKKGDTSARHYDINNPVYNLEIFKADRRILNTKVYDTVSFDGYTLRFLSPTYWEILEAVWDPLYPFFVLSLFLCTFGLLFGSITVFMKS